MTKKGEEIQEKIIRTLDRNPDGLRIGQLQKLLNVSRNSVYRYLDLLQMKGSICKLPDKNWVLKEPIRPQTIFGYQYQAVLQGLKVIGGSQWDIEVKEGRENFKKLGRHIYTKMKFPELDMEEFQKKSHHLTDIIENTLKLLQETRTVETFQLNLKLDKNGFPDRSTNLAGIITFEGGYILSEQVSGNGFAHYYIIGGIVEQCVERLIKPIFGGRTVVDLIKFDEERQLVDLALYVIFDSKTPFIGPLS